MRGLGSLGGTHNSDLDFIAPIVNGSILKHYLKIWVKIKSDLRLNFFFFLNFVLYQGCQGKAEDPSWRNSDWCCGEKEANWSWREGSGQKRQRISCYSETTRWSWELQSGNNCTRKKVLTLFIQMYSVLFSNILMVWIYRNFWVTGLITDTSDNLIVFVIL